MDVVKAVDVVKVWTPRRLADWAQALMTDPPPSMLRCWPRASATLIRIALEQTLVQFWTVATPLPGTPSAALLRSEPIPAAAAALARAPMRHQLLALPHYADAEVVATVQSTWNGLSRAVHHHAYELAPTLAELRGWHAQVIWLMNRLDQQSA